MTIDFYPRAVDIVDAGYENVAAVCSKCGVRNVYNRASDIGHFDPIANHHVVCEGSGCQAAFDIYGDLISPAYKTLVRDSCNFLKEKRYAQAVLSAATAYESLFSHFLRVELVYRPLRRDATSDIDEIEWLNATHDCLQDRIARHTFEPMRKIFLRIALDLDNIRPATVTAAKTFIIMRIPKSPQEVKKVEVARHEIEGIVDEHRRTLLLRVHDSGIATLRNHISHKTAYRPLFAEAKAAVDDASETIFKLGRHYKLEIDNYHLNESLDDP